MQSFLLSTQLCQSHLVAVERCTICDAHHDGHDADDGNEQSKRHKRKMRPSWNRLLPSFLAFLLLYSFQFAQIVTRRIQNGAADSLPRELALSDFVEQSTGLLPRNNTNLHSFNYSDHKYCFIHVGKTAGSKISCELGYTYAPECKKQHALSQYHYHFYFYNVIEVEFVTWDTSWIVHQKQMTTTFS